MTVRGCRSRRGRVAGCRRRAVSTSPQLSLGRQVAGGARNALPARFVRSSGSCSVYCRGHRSRFRCDSGPVAVVLASLSHRRWPCSLSRRAVPDVQTLAQNSLFLGLHVSTPVSRLHICFHLFSLQFTEPVALSSCLVSPKKSLFLHLTVFALSPPSVFLLCAPPLFDFDSASFRNSPSFQFLLARPFAEWSPSMAVLLLYATEENGAGVRPHTITHCLHAHAHSPAASPLLARSLTLSALGSRRAHTRACLLPMSTRRADTRKHTHTRALCTHTATRREVVVASGQRMENFFLSLFTQCLRPGRRAHDSHSLLGP